jgi:type IV secretion system protein VirB1
MELMNCSSLAVPDDVMQHVVHIESSYNPYAIGVVGGKLARQPRNLAEALATVRMLEGRGFNFSVGLAQINRYNLARYGLDSYERAFEACPNLQAGSRILAECYSRSGGSWGKSFSCYYSGNFTTGYRHGYVQKVYASMRNAPKSGSEGAPIEVIGAPVRKSAVAAVRRTAPTVADQLIAKRATTAISTRVDVSTPPQGSPTIVSPQTASQSPQRGAAVAFGTAAAAPQVTAADQAFVF